MFGVEGLGFRVEGFSSLNTTKRNPKSDRCHKILRSFTKSRGVEALGLQGLCLAAGIGFVFWGSRLFGRRVLGLGLRGVELRGQSSGFGASYFQFGSYGGAPHGC